MGFRGILKLAAKSLDNWEFMSWLMDRFDPENMSIEVEEGKQISVTGHSVKCIFELLSKGGDPPPATDDTGKKLLMSVIEHLLPDEPSPKDVKVNPARTAKMIEMYTNTGWPNLDEDLCIRIFFHGAEQQLPNPKHILLHQAYQCTMVYGHKSDSGV
jgi:hypothetical protein